jgi:lysozyme
VRKRIRIVVENVVNRQVLVPLNQNQFDALVDFCFNVGAANFTKSSLLRMVNMKSFKTATREFLLWDKVDGRVVPGLTARRTAEMNLWLTA